MENNVKIKKIMFEIIIQPSTVIFYKGVAPTELFLFIKKDLLQKLFLSE
jgi:hypothetical protein